MPTQITNQARLTYLYDGSTRGTATSNVATATVEDALEATKTSLETSYRANDEITYIITVANNCCAGETAVTVTDNLGSFTPAGCPAAVNPLTYVGPANLYIDGVLSSSLEVDDAEDTEVSFTIPSLASGSNAIIIYKAQVNEFAPLAEGSTIENTATVTMTGACTQTAEISDTIDVASYADVSIVKSMSTCPGGCNAITYTFELYNSGNSPATNVALTDTFNPVPTITAITVDGDEIEPTEYTFENGTLTLPGGTATQTITVPAATVTTTCEGTTVVPGNTEIVVTGTLNTAPSLPASDAAAAPVRRK